MDSEEIAGRVLALVGREGALPPPFRWLAQRFLKMNQVLTRRASVTTVLGLDGVTVPYRPSSVRFGMESFPLALDGTEHAVARARLGAALAASSQRHDAGVEAAGQKAAAVLAAATGPMNLVDELIDPCLRAWLEEWFGLPLVGAGVDAMVTSRLLAHAMFFDPDAAAMDAAVASADALCAHFVAAMGSTGSAPATSLAAALLAHPRGRGSPPEATARDLLGLTVGPLALGSWALANASFELLAKPPGLEGLADPTVARSAFSEALARRPPLPWLPRVNDRERRILGHQRLVTLPAGPVLAATACAAARDACDACDGFTPELAPFGFGPHQCMGIEHIGAVAARVLAVMAGRRPALADEHAQGPVAVPTLEWPAPFPARLSVAFASP